MKKLLASTALLMAFAGAASAQQSVLERVLAQVDNSTNLASVNGTFANIAENIGGTTTVYNNGTTTLTVDEFAALASADHKANYTSVAGTSYISNDGSSVVTAAQYALLSAADKAEYTLVSSTSGIFVSNLTGEIITNEEYNGITYANAAAVQLAVDAYNAVTVSGLEGINGSINNVINGLDTATMVAAVGSITATEYLLPTIDLGNISSTVLGAVNTGEITLGVNQAVDQAKTTSTGALSSVIDQIGGSADTGALVLNIASNMTGVNGSINNTMTGVNGSVGTAATTVLGAVNTGTIISGINAAVTGIVGGTAQSGL